MDHSASHLVGPLRPTAGPVPVGLGVTTQFRLRHLKSVAAWRTQSGPAQYRQVPGCRRLMKTTSIPVLENKKHMSLAAGAALLLHPTEKKRNHPTKHSTHQSSHQKLGDGSRPTMFTRRLSTIFIHLFGSQLHLTLPQTSHLIPIS